MTSNDLWSDWNPFPDPRRGEMLIAPFGPGVYELRHVSSQELILFGCGGHAAMRMTSLLPAPHGRGTRNNDAKRQYVLDNIGDIEYRTIACANRPSAVVVERSLRHGSYRFRT